MKGRWREGFFRVTCEAMMMMIIIIDKIILVLLQFMIMETDVMKRRTKVMLVSEIFTAMILIGLVLRQRNLFRPSVRTSDYSKVYALRNKKNNNNNNTTTNTTMDHHLQQQQLQTRNSNNCNNNNNNNNDNSKTKQLKKKL